MLKKNWNFIFILLAGFLLGKGPVSYASVESVTTESVDLDAWVSNADSEWVCHSIGSEGPNMTVRVLDEGSYKIQVEQICDRSIYPIATVQGGKFDIHSGEVVYSGISPYSGQSNRASKIELHIQSRSDQTLELSSSIKIETLRSGSMGSPWAGVVVPLKCSPTHLSLDRDRF